MMAPHVVQPAARWQAPGREQDLLCWRVSELAVLRDALGAAMAAWCADWGVPALTEVACRAVTESSAADAAVWEGLQWREGQVGGWLHGSEAGQCPLGLAMFAAEPAPDSGAARLSHACGQDARARVLRFFSLSRMVDRADPPGAGTNGPWSGAVEVLFPPPLGWRLLLQGEVVRGWCRAQGSETAPPASRPPSPLVPASEALHRSKVVLAVHLEGCELELGALQRLQPGDVVRLQHPLAVPASVTGATGAALFQAYLGRSGGLKAVELALAAPAETSHKEAIA